MSIFTNIVLAVISVLLFCLIITLHEFGHYIMAKFSRIKVNEFAIGMGPVLYKKQKGDTQYSIRALPIGGYCAMEGEDKESTDVNSFASKPAWKRILVVAMGAIFNILLGFILIVAINCGQKEFKSTTVGKIHPSVVSSETSSLKEGDKIISINGNKINIFNDFNFFYSLHKKIDNEGDLKIKVLRNGEELELNKIPTIKKDSVELLAFSFVSINNNFLTLIGQSFGEVISTVRMVWSSLTYLVTGRVSFKEMSGPVGIASNMTKNAAEGLKRGGFLLALTGIVRMLALITINLGVVNLLPLPALDGGRLVFLFIELLFRKKVPAKYEGWIHAAGIVLLLLLMLIISIGDISKLLGN